MGILLAIIIGGVAGWIAEKVMKSDHGVLTNIVLGVAGAFLASIVFSFIGVSFSGIGGQLIAGVAGACLLIFLGRGMRGRE
ncbi:MAG: GlsB/YeaQ/YmgE family stress response membrane protein [Pseudomonadota bacterium]